MAGFEYQWQECVKTKLFGGCKQWAPHVDTYDLTDPAVRDKLINMGFVAQVGEVIK